MEPLNKDPVTSSFISSTALTDTCRAFSLSITGLSHEKYNEPLQDCSSVAALPNGWILGIVADGVGSEPHSDIGSNIAVESFKELLIENWGKYADMESILTLLNAGFQHAVGSICREAMKAGNPIQEYSTTLHAAILANGVLYYAHAGDGGILALTDSGNYISVTIPQKDIDGECVIPLLAGPKYWEFGSVPDTVQSVMLCTDGVYDKLCNRMLKKYAEGVDIPSASVFLSPYALDDRDPEAAVDICKQIFRGGDANCFYPFIVKAVAQGEIEQEDKAGQFVVEHIYDRNRPLKRLQGITDDISVAVIQKTQISVMRHPMDRYQAPDWDSIYKKISEDLYSTDETV